ncbi:response regulator transcription factor [Burkholderia gladioli]|uniref:Bacterial regulatory s, luxR family protein n=1 Tax=Burkholderia gladioli TaxID=28095 RepID=A0AAW3F6M9_BURGA|nr:response regulator transcription factor [Burkholderia gladioli]AJW95491.1 bacterial regulatory s, luxR family protein [Burkholderia gladioli]ASD83437.1 DNA-binding response regulator [Burkholderia gladioli pv. gladioli]AWY50864.1 DNA-binding response regulator [Burkholderia gladioli pv. gladioli]KGC15736.1 bacterial regulatory s, luxR family protein [Burkholderia gladioli]MBU9186231.1 response regulator transcription factor [Burkholderia gladioli]
MNSIAHDVPSLSIALLDSHELVRFALCTRIEQEPGWTVVGAFGAAGELLDALAAGADIGLIVMNHVLDASDGLDVVWALRASYPAVRILICSEFERADTIARLFQLGVHGFIGRTQSLDDHIEAVRKVASGNTYFSARVIGTRSTSNGFARPSPAAPGMPALKDASTLLTHPDLTARERAVLAYCLEGLSISQIADRVGRGYKTISSQKQAAYRKLGVRNDAELIAMLSHHERGPRGLE